MANRLSELTARMTAMDNIEVEKDFSGLIYGPPGAGKTTLALQLAQELAGGDPILYLDSADNYVSISNPATKHLMQNVTRIRLEGGSDLSVIVDALSKRKPGWDKFAVVIVDEHSSVAQWTLEDVVRDALGLRPDEDLPDFEGKLYGPMTNIMASQLRNLKKIEGLHFILVAHSRDKADRREVVKSSPEYSPLLQAQVQKLMHVTAYMSAEITTVKGQPAYTRKIQSQPSGLIMAKCRVPGMPVITTPQDWVERVADWVYEDLAETGVDPEGELPSDTVAEDIPPTDGLPAGESDDDEPAYAE